MFSTQVLFILNLRRRIYIRRRETNNFIPHSPDFRVAFSSTLVRIILIRGSIYECSMNQRQPRDYIYLLLNSDNEHSRDLWTDTCISLRVINPTYEIIDRSWHRQPIVYFYARYSISIVFSEKCKLTFYRKILRYIRRKIHRKGKKIMQKIRIIKEFKHMII